MGKASSSKKVARAAGTGGGRTSRGRTPWTYYSVIALIVILGIVGTVTSRDRRLGQINTAGDTAPTVGTTWNEGYAVYACGKFLPPIKNAKDPQGITAGQGDGIIHIHPTVKASAGKNATLGKFASAVGMKLNSAELQLPGGHRYLDGDSCNGKTSHIYVKQFSYVKDTTGALQTVDPRNIKLEDQSMLTIAFVPASDKNKIPPPPQYVITNLTKLAASSSTTTTTAPKTTPTTKAPTGATTTTPTTRPTTTQPTTTTRPSSSTTSKP
jgi:hypothetical protein